MESRLSEAARTGNVGSFQNLLRENPLILADFALTSQHENPLHIAAKAGQLVFVQEIISHQPEFARESNQDGFRPMDIASAFGYAEIVKELLVISPEICRLAGRDGRTALHYAAMNDRVEVIDELLSTCGESVKDVTTLGETALHLAVKYCKFEAIRCLIKWLEQLGVEELVNWGDREGNTVLHISVSRKQLECVEVLLSSSNTIKSSLELNATNSRGLTAMDILEIVSSGSPCSDIQLREILQCAGALKACNIINGISLAPPSPLLPHHVTSSSNNQNNQGLLPAEVPSKDWFKYFKFQLQRDSPSDARNALLVVAALIATVTFQAGVNPPPGFLQGKGQDDNSASSPASPPVARPPTQQAYLPAGTNILAALFGSIGFLATSTWFLFANTLGLAASLSIIIYLTAGFPFQRELQISIYSMMFAYGFSILQIQQHGAAKYVLPVIAFVLPILLRWLPRWAKKAWKSLERPPSRDRAV